MCFNLSNFLVLSLSHLINNNNNNKGYAVTRERSSSGIESSSSNSSSSRTDNGASSSQYVGGARWTSLDMSGATLRNLSPSLFNYIFLTQLRLNNNQLTSIPSAIGLLKNLTLLDLSMNRIRSLPAEIGSCMQLREVSVNHAPTTEKQRKK
jgi:CCR4-NOT transcription complex subunit 6